MINASSCMHRGLALHVLAKFGAEIGIRLEMVEKREVSVHGQIIRRLVALGWVGPFLSGLREGPHAGDRAMKQVRKPRRHASIFNKDG